MPPEVRSARLTPDGVRYFNDVDRQQMHERAKLIAAQVAAREPLRIEMDELSRLPEFLGGRDSKPTQTIVLHVGRGKAITVKPNGRTEVAAIEEMLLRKLEEPRVVRHAGRPAQGLVIARNLGKTGKRQ